MRADIARSPAKTPPLASHSRHGIHRPAAGGWLDRPKEGRTGSAVRPVSPPDFDYIVTWTPRPWRVSSRAVGAQSIDDFPRTKLYDTRPDLGSRIVEATPATLYSCRGNTMRSFACLFAEFAASFDSVGSGGQADWSTMKRIPKRATTPSPLVLRLVSRDAARFFRGSAIAKDARQRGALHTITPCFSSPWILLTNLDKSVNRPRCRRNELTLALHCTAFPSFSYARV